MQRCNSSHPIRPQTQGTAPEHEQSAPSNHRSVVPVSLDFKQLNRAEMMSDLPRTKEKEQLEFWVVQVSACF